MKARAMTLEQIRWRGLKALSEELGPVGLVRFLQQFETGQGDYTAERRRWLGEVTVDDLTQEMQDKRKPAAAEE
jgi:hypothetical protein